MWEEQTEADPVEEEMRAQERGTLGLILRCCPPEELDVEVNRRLTLPVELSKILGKSHLTSPWFFCPGYQGCIHLVSACFLGEYRRWITKKVKNKEARALIVNGLAGARFELSGASKPDTPLFQSQFRRVTIPAYLWHFAGIVAKREDPVVLAGAQADDQTCSWLEIWSLRKKLEFDALLLAGKSYHPGLELCRRNSVS
jgi:hypothetical protein